MAIKLGFAGKVFRHTVLWATTPTNSSVDAISWNEIPGVNEASISYEPAAADTTRKGNGGFKTSLPAAKEVSFEFDMPYDPADTDIIALLAAATAGTELPMLFMDGDYSTAGNQGFTGNFWFSFNISQGQEEAQRITFTAHLSDYGFWYIAP